MKILQKLFLIILLWGTYFLPIYFFQRAFRVFRSSTDNFYGIYSDGLFQFGIIAIVLTLVYFWIAAKLFHKLFLRIGVILSFIIFYGYACIFIAWDHRSIFGVTWQWSEIFPELVQPEWYFYVMGVLGMILNYQVLRFIQQSFQKA